jgi:transcription-repair coupling factor (superfamily II helicase)
MASELTLWRPLIEAPFLADLDRRLSRGESGLCLTGLVEGSRALVLALLGALGRHRFTLVVADDAAVESYQRDLAALSELLGRDARRVLSVSALDADPYDGIPPHPEVVRERVVALGRLARRDVEVLLLPARALLQWMPSPAEWASWTRTVRRGDELAPDRFVLRALSLGYRRVDTVTAPGEVSRRGGIVDIFPPAADEPVRVELFGDTVESLRSFDTDHQRSTGELTAFAMGPAIEHPPTEDVVARLGLWLEGGRSVAAGDADALRALRDRLESLRERGYWPGIEALARLGVAEPSLVLEHAPDHLLVVDEPERVELALAQAEADLERTWKQSGDRLLPPPADREAPSRCRVVDPGAGRGRAARRHLRPPRGEPLGPGVCRPRPGSRRRPAGSGGARCAHGLRDACPWEPRPPARDLRRVRPPGRTRGPSRLGCRTVGRSRRTRWCRVAALRLRAARDRPRGDRGA